MKLFISCFFGLLFTAQASAQLLIAPTRFVLDADTSVTEKIVVENNSDEPIRLEIKPIYRPVKASGLVRTDENIAESENIADWIKVSPPIIRELKPNQRRTVRLRMNALPDDMPDGEYRAYLWFSPIAKLLKLPRQIYPERFVPTTVQRFNSTFISTAMYRFMYKKASRYKM